MNMKKVLAVVLAVMLSISAMAVSVFAEEYLINLTKDKTNSGYAYASTVDFEIPVYPTYGYATNDLVLTFTLPAWVVKTEHVVSEVTETVTTVHNPNENTYEPVWKLHDEDNETPILDENGNKIPETDEEGNIVYSETVLFPYVETITVATNNGGYSWSSYDEQYSYVATGADGKAYVLGYANKEAAYNAASNKVEVSNVAGAPTVETTTDVKKTCDECDGDCCHEDAITTTVVTTKTTVETVITTNGFGTAEYVVKFGNLPSDDFNGVTWLPQSVLVGDNGVIKMTGTFPIIRNAKNEETKRVNAKSFLWHKDGGAMDWCGNADRSWWCFVTDVWAFALDANAPVVRANDRGSVDDGSGTYSFDWNPVDGADLYTGDTYNQAGLKGYWDATLANQAAIMGAESALVRVTLNKNIVGNYYFGLIAKYTNGATYDLYNNFNNWGWANKAYASYIEVAAPTSVIEFPIDKEVLYNTMYGIWNHEMEVVCVNDIHLQAVEMIKEMRAITSVGTFGNYSWDKDNIYYYGEAINNWWNQWNEDGTGGNYVVPTSFDIVLTVADEEPVETPDDIEIETPVESETEETDEDNVVVDDNPTTGVALALVPAAIALAVVALKRR